jgi:hypothetical protein
MNRLNLSGLMALGLAVLLTACGASTETQRFKIVVEVDTAEGIRTGQSVVEETVSPAPWYTIGENRYSSSFKGEAVAIDLPNGQTMFALLRNDGRLDLPNLIGRTLYPAGRDQGQPLRRMVDPPMDMRTQAPRAPRGESGLPMLVTFENEDDPTSLQQVDPGNLERSFGPGTHLRRITIQVTDEPVSTGISGRLPWLSEIGRLRGTIIPDPPEFVGDATPIQTVSPLDFSSELYR